MSHLSFMLSLTMILQQCHIFAMLQFQLIGQILYIPLLRLKCIPKSKLEPGNQFRTYKSNKEIFQAKANLYPLLLKIVMEWKTRLRSLIAVTNGYYLRINLALYKRSIMLIATANDNSQIWQMPTPIDLDSSGLRCSSRTEVMKRCDKVYSNTMTLKNQTAHLHLASPPRSFKSALVLFSTICSFGYGLSCMAHSLQEKVTLTSTFSKGINSYHQVNTLYYGTINCFLTLAQSSIA
jgi:hypothetical protein